MHRSIMTSRVKTCETCATAKIRCLRSPGAAICDRCARLNKPCYFRPSRVRQTWTKKETRLESLERRVDQLLGQSQSHASPEENSGDVIDKGILSLDDAAALLDYYLQYMMPHFPFVALPERATVGELREQKPFLFLAILSVSVMEDRALKRALDDEVKTATADRTVLQDKPPALETVQGLLVVLAWSQHQASRRIGPQIFATFLHLAIGLVVDLELDRPVEVRKFAGRMSVHETRSEPRPPAVLKAEKRAVLGCSFLSSSFGIITQRKVTLPWTAHMERFAIELAQDPDYDGDKSIMHLVRLQHIFEEMDKVSSESEDTSMSGTAFQRTFRTFKSQLQDYADQLSQQVAGSNYLLASQLNTVSLYLCQVSLFDRMSTSSQLPSAFRAEILGHGLTAAKALFSSLAHLPMGSERRMSYSEWLQSRFSMILSCKLSLMAVSDEVLRTNHPQIQSLCNELDMPQILRICVVRQQSQEPRSEARRTGFDYTGWLQYVEEWFGRHHHGYTSRQRGTPVPGSEVPDSTTASRAGLGTGPGTGTGTGTATGIPANTTATAIPVTYPPPAPAPFMSDVSSGLDLPVTGDMLAWTSFPDFWITENPLAGWMDLGLMPM